ncbi:hypothetical protein [Knoellia sp. LjRoot47]|uniref:hypothetical protein n=1 Tax=Knoellia sp. LjRoot47 TaxID=3342330 RepID=UPI003ECFD3B6
MARTDSTTEDLVEAPRGFRGQLAHRTGLAIVVLIVVAGMAGLLGPRTSTETASAGGWRLTVEHASITRSGQPAPLHLRVEHAEGFTQPVQIALCDGLFDHLDFQNWYPNPSAETSSPGRLLYEFDPPSGSVLEVSLDARAAPGQWGGHERCRATVLVDDAPVVGADFGVRVVP